MPSIRYGLSSYTRGVGGLPEFPVINMYAEQAPTETTGTCLHSRPGMADTGRYLGEGPISGLFQASGVLDGAFFAVSGGVFFAEEEEYSAVGSGPVSWGAFEDSVYVTAGAALRKFDGSNFSLVPFPSGNKVLAITVGSSRILGIEAGSGRFFWSDSLSDNIDALSFATAESSPDRLLDILYVADAAILFGAETVEFWPNTGENDLPFRPLEGRVIERGIRNTGACTYFGGGFAWVTNTHQVCVQSLEGVVSNTGLQRRIEASDACELFRFTLEGNEFLALRLDDETQVYSSTSGMWSRFETYGMANWNARCWVNGLFGGDDGTISRWALNYDDDAADQALLERRFRALVPVDSGALPITNMTIRTSPGLTGYDASTASAPKVEMRVSRDLGNTWSNWLPEQLGQKGEYRKAIQWRALGRATRPGFMAEFRVTDPVPFRVSDVLINEAWGAS